MAVDATQVDSRHQPPLALLVDRDQDTRQMYAEFLRLSSYDIEEADDGRDALAKSLTLRPDIVVTETRLPGIDGFELCHLLRADSTTKDVPIVFVTADAFADQVKRAEASGADVVLVKPCLPEILFAEMRRLLALSTDLRERARVTREKISEQLERSERVLDRSRRVFRRVTLTRAHSRHDTITPPTDPPTLLCPACDRSLRYQRSHIGGVNAQHTEQWDYFECPAGCGTFQYRQRTRKLRRVS